MRAAMRRAWMRSLAVFRSAQAEDELAREMAAHLAVLEDEFRQRGLSDDEARRAARAALGGLDQAKEQHRDARSFPWPEDLRRDLEFAVRGFVKAPTFPAAVVATLALAIGATTAVFAVVHAVLLKPLTFAARPGELVRLVAHTPDTATPSGPPLRREVLFTADEAQLLAERSRSLQGAGVVAPTIMSISGVDGAGRLSGARISASVLGLLQATPLMGRAFTADDERGGEDVVLIGETAWQRVFARDPQIVGRTLTFDTVLGPRTSASYRVVGVMPASFRFPTAQADFWMLPRPGQTPPLRGRLLARLAPGTTPERALVDVGEAAREIRQLGPDARLELTRELDELVRNVRPALVALMAAVVVLLGIATMNVAALGHASGLARERELAVRAALGASRSRLLRQGLTEFGLLGAAGGVAGVGVALIALAAFRRLAATLSRIDLASQAAFPRLDEVALDGAVLAVSASVTIATTVLVGLSTAARAARTRTFVTVRERAAARDGALRRRRVLVIGQIAGAMTLLVGAVLLAGTLRQLLTTPTGYERTNRLTFQVALPVAHYADARLREFAESLAARLGSLPRVEAVGYANQLPMVQLRDTGGGLWRTPDPARKAAPDAADARYVSPGYLDAMGIRIVRGRGFAAGDAAGQSRVVLVNEALARRQFADRDPVGAAVYVGRDVVPWTVVGVVADVRQFGLARPPEPQYFVDLRQWTPGGVPLFPIGAYVVVATTRDPLEIVPDVRALVKSLDAEGTLFNVAPMDQIVSSTVTQPRLFATVMGAFAASGALLAAIGVYGVLACLVRTRRQEFGVRMALGASRRDILLLVTREGTALVAAGLVVGTAGALVLSGSIEGLLYGVAPRDPASIIGAGALLVAVAAIAVLAPATRATRVDAVSALRCE